MPFEQAVPRAFTVVGVRAHAPAESGVYGISNGGEWIYIGEADNIQAALMGHLQDKEAAVQRRRPTGFVYEICAQAGRPKRQDRLVQEYEPVCNRHWTGHR